MFCPNCGQQISEDSRFCELCGSSVAEKPPVPTPPPAQQRQAPPPMYAEHNAPAEQNSHIKNHTQAQQQSHTVQPLQKKRSGAPKALLIAAVLVVVVAGVWFLKGWLDDREPKVYEPEQNPSVQTQQPADTKPADETPETEHGQQLEPGQPSIQEQQPVGQDTGEHDVSGIEGIEDIDIEADGEYITALFSTYDRPAMEDFGWYEEVFQNGMWSGANPVTELPYMMGGWKCYIVYDPDRTMDSYAQELANVNIDGAPSDISLTVDWYQAYWEGEAPFDESDMEDSVYTGSYEDGEFYLTGPGNIILSDFYEYEGYYYGFGSLLTPDGITADFCLMR